MPLGEFLVEGEEEGIVTAFISDAGGRGPGTVSKVLFEDRESEDVSFKRFYS